MNNRVSTVVLVVLLLLAGCNTINGMGKDIKAGGQAIEDASTTKKKTN